MGIRTLSSRVFLAACVLGLAGCASGYKEYYRPTVWASSEAISRLRVAPPGEPLVERVSAISDMNTFDVPYYRRGYVAIGSSMFNHGRPQRDEDGIAQGREMGADLVVLVGPRLSGTNTSVVPITTRTTTSYIPVTTNRFDYGAIYFIKWKFSFGASYRDLGERERKELQTNRGGAVIDIIVNQSPAFYADVLEGDIITGIDGEKVLDEKGFTDQLTARNGQKVMLSIYRAGQRLEKPVQLLHLSP